MRRTAPLLSALLVAAALMALLPGASLAETGSPPPIIVEDPSFAAPAAPAKGPSPAVQQAVAVSPITVMLEIEEPPADAAQRLEQIALSQSELVQRLEALGIPVLFQARAAYTGVAVAAAVDQLPLLSGLPGVAGVHIIPPKARGSTSVATANGAASLWSQSRPQALGHGVRIGIIDSGIDYTHATFGGQGTNEAYAANDPTVVEPGSFPTAKVVAGYDFVGDGYDAAGIAGSPIPAPDGDPLDCAATGHGTHAASIAAGYGVDEQGATFRGPYSAGVSFEQFLVQPGVAPEASLVALKIFGCQGETTTFLTAAIDYALDPNRDGNTDDRLVDVLNISLGSPFGGSDDPDAVAVERAVQAGVVVVVSAGDSGDVFYSLASPASAPLAIAVGASVDEAGASDTAPAGTLWSGSARGPQQSGIKPDLVAPGVAISAAAAGSGNSSVAMTGTAVAAPQVAGAAALLHQLHPSWSPAQIKAALVNTAAPLQLPDGTAYPPSLAGAGQLNLEQLAGRDLVAYPSDTPGESGLSFGVPWVSGPIELQRELTIENTGSTPRTVRLDAVTTAAENGVELHVPSGTTTVPPNGQVRVPVTLTVQPHLLDNTPDPATALTHGATPRYYLAEHAGYVQVSSTVGTRVRFVHIARTDDVEVKIGGKELDDDLDPGDVSKYVRVSPGSQLVKIVPDDDSRAGPILRQMVTLLDGQDYTFVLWGRRGNFQLFVLEEGQTTIPDGAGLVTFFNGDPYGDGSAVDFYVDRELVVAGLPVGESRQLAIAGGLHRVRVVRAGGSIHKARISKAINVRFGGQALFAAGKKTVFARHSHLAAGTAQNRQTLRVPFQIFPRAASLAAASAPVFPVPADSPTFTLTLNNTGARNAALGTGQNQQVALVSAFQLDQGGVSPVNSAIPEELRFADLQYVGVTTNLPVTQDIASGNTVLFFGLASHAPWNTPNEVEFRVYIDSNLDNVPDYVLVTTSLSTSDSSLQNSGPANDVFVNRLFALPPGGAPQYTFERAFWNSLPSPSSGFATAGIDPAPFNTRVTFLSARVSTLGLSLAQPRARYYVETRARNAGGFATVLDRVPATGYLEYNLLAGPAAPVNFVDQPLAARPLFAATEGGQVTGVFNRDALAERGSQQLLLLYHHNPPASQAEVVTLASSPATACAPSPGGCAALSPTIAVSPLWIGAEGALRRS